MPEKYFVDIKAMLDCISDGIFILDKDWNFIFINRAAEKMNGLAKDEIIGLNYWDTFPKARNLRFWDELHRAINEDTAVYFEEYSPSFEQWVSVNAYPAEKNLIIYFRFITAEKEIRDKIRFDEASLRTLVNNTDEPIWAIDNDCNIILANNAFKAWIKNATGVDMDKGDNVLKEELGKVYLDKFVPCYQLALSGKKFNAIEDMNRGDDSRYYLVSFTPVFNDEKAVIGASCFARDITEYRKHLFKIEAQNRALTEIANIQSHKVRGPVATILGLAQLFNYDDYTDPVNKEILSGILTVTEELDATIREVVKKTVQIGI